MSIVNCTFRIMNTLSYKTRTHWVIEQEHTELYNKNTLSYRKTTHWVIEQEHTEL